MDAGSLPSEASSTAHARHWLWNLSKPAVSDGTLAGTRKVRQSRRRQESPGSSQTCGFADSVERSYDVGVLLVPSPVVRNTTTRTTHDTTAHQPRSSPYSAKKTPPAPQDLQNGHRLCFGNGVHGASKTAGWNRANEVWGGREMGFIRRNSEGPLPQQRNGADGATGPRWSSTGAARHQHWSGQARRESSGVSDIADQDQPHHALRHGPACNKRRCMTDGASNALRSPRCCMGMRIRRSFVGIRRLVPILPIMPRANLPIHVARPTEKGVPDGFRSQKGRPAKPQRDGHGPMSTHRHVRGGLANED